MPVPGGCGIMRFDTSLLWPTPRWEDEEVVDVLPPVALC